MQRGQLSMNKRDLVLGSVHQRPCKCVRFCCVEAACHRIANEYKICQSLHILHQKVDTNLVLMYMRLEHTILKRK